MSSVENTPTTQKIRPLVQGAPRKASATSYRQRNRKTEEAKKTLIFNADNKGGSKNGLHVTSSTV